MDALGNILLTGATGMVGRNILERFQKEGIEPLAPTHAELDLLDGLAVEKYLQTRKPGLIIHCAGVVGGIQANINEPVRFLHDNMLIGMNIIMGARKAGVKRFLNIASSCMYPANSACALTEDMVLSGTLESTNEGYALAKCASTRLCQHISRKNPVFQYKTLIPCNLYGKYDKFDPEKSHLLAAIILKIDSANMNGEAEVVIWGDGEGRREFMYAGDLASLVFMATLDFDRLPETMNVGTGADFSIDEYYQIVARIMRYAGSFRHDHAKPGGMRRRLLDISRQTAFGFFPAWTLEQGIKETYAYYQSLQACQPDLG